MKDSVLDAEILRLETDLPKVGAAITALALGAEFYIIDTGQTKQTVRNHQIKDVQTAYRDMWDQYSDLCNRRGSAVIVAAPAW